MTSDVPTGPPLPTKVRRLDISATLSLMEGDEDGEVIWAVLVHVDDDEPDIVGNHPDMTKALLLAVEALYAQSLAMQGITVTGPDVAGRELLTWTRPPEVPRG